MMTVRPPRPGGGGATPADLAAPCGGGAGDHAAAISGAPRDRRPPAALGGGRGTFRPPTARRRSYFIALPIQPPRDSRARGRPAAEKTSRRKLCAAISYSVLIIVWRLYGEPYCRSALRLRQGPRAGGRAAGDARLRAPRHGRPQPAGVAEPPGPAGRARGAKCLSEMLERGPRQARARVTRPAAGGHRRRGGRRQRACGAGARHGAWGAR
jgi:hypothetical protein